ncbi:MAG TPA: AAA family ATPase [Candidatus Saccharimonadales bacterium]|nr:AAA family ATPase [Candidatus Saccharimonadales bacterium]
MWISELQVLHLKSFTDSGPLQLSKGINVLVGKNNAGKSTLQQAVLCLQANQQALFSQTKEIIRIGSPTSTVRIHLRDIEEAYFNTKGISDGDQGNLTIQFTPSGQVQEFTPEGEKSATITDIKTITNQEPNNFIVPYTLKRVGRGFENLTTGNGQATPTYVFETLAQLANKIHPLTQTTHRHHARFDELCTSLIGSPMGIIEGPYGHLPGIYAGQNGSIPLSQMGDGVPNIVGLIVHLLKAERKLFIIEELENSINPEPLKLLLEEIKTSAKERQNQFLISTHSNIVLQSLASENDCKIIEVTQTPARPGEVAESSCTEIEKGDVEARRRILKSLGYSLADSDMFDGWLILEEASAETIIRRFLIPQFAPKLANVLGIIATRGYNQVENQFTALAQNFLYLHLTPAYQKRIWVVVDAGDKEREVIEHLQHDFGSWLPEHFDQFGKHDFEEYYPSYFHDEVKEILNLPVNSDEKRKKKQKAKKGLLLKVMGWIEEDIKRAEREFESSAQEVIAKLKNIENRLIKATAESSQNSVLMLATAETRANA